MSAKLIELRDQLIIDAGIEGDPKFPAPRLNRMIALAEKYVQTQLIPLGLKKWEKVLTVTTSGGVADGLTDAAFNSATNNVSTISMPFTDTLISYLNDVLESPASILFIDCKYKLLTDSSYGLAYEVDKDRFKEVLSNTYFAPTKKQPIFMRLNNKIWIAPLVDAASLQKIDQVDVFYHKVITDISVIISPATTADDNRTEIPVEFEEHIIRKAKIEIDEILGRSEKKASASRQLDREILMAFNKFAGKQFEVNRAAQQSKKTKLQ
jgi:hypothetical protein